MMNNRTTIIPVASGKGGVGKSVLSANLSIYLASMGYSVIAIDLDLGASNLNTYLGLPNHYPGIGDYLKTRSMRFSDLPVKTGIPNLWFIPGDGRIPFMANISYDQRRILLNEIRKLAVDYIILDLGAGSRFNTLNFFGLSQSGLILTTVETPAVMNFVMFLRNFVLRELSGAVHSNESIVDMLMAEYNQPAKSRPLTVRTLIEKIRRMDPGMATLAERAVRRFRPRVIFNMAEGPGDLDIVTKIDATLKHGLSLEAEFFGCVFYDEGVRRAGRNKEVPALTYPDSIFSRSVRAIAKSIVENRNQIQPVSIESLIGNTNKNYNEWKYETGTVVQ